MPRVGKPVQYKRYTKKLLIIILFAVCNGTTPYILCGIHIAFVFSNFIGMCVQYLIIILLLVHKAN